jgi:hypothetical protein
MMENYKVWLDSEFIYVENESGEIGKKPISKYHALASATKEQRDNFELSSCGVHWYELDVDLAFDSFFHPEKYNLRAGEVAYADAL